MRQPSPCRRATPPTFVCVAKKSHLLIPSVCICTTSAPNAVLCGGVLCRQEAGNVPWHQDSAYCHPDSWNTLQVRWGWNYANYSSLTAPLLS
jgi:hypothetical protein